MNGWKTAAAFNLKVTGCTGDVSATAIESHSGALRFAKSQEKAWRSRSDTQAIERWEFKCDSLRVQPIDRDGEGVVRQFSNYTRAIGLFEAQKGCLPPFSMTFSFHSKPSQGPGGDGQTILPTGWTGTFTSRNNRF